MTGVRGAGDVIGRSPLARRKAAWGAAAFRAVSRCSHPGKVQWVVSYTQRMPMDAAAVIAGSSRTLAPRPRSVLRTSCWPSVATLPELRPREDLMSPITPATSYPVSAARPDRAGRRLFGLGRGARQVPTREGLGWGQSQMPLGHEFLTQTRRVPISRGPDRDGQDSGNPARLRRARNHGRNNSLS